MDDLGRSLGLLAPEVDTAEALEDFRSRRRRRRFARPVLAAAVVAALIAVAVVVAGQLEDDGTVLVTTDPPAPTTTAPGGPLLADEDFDLLSRHEARGASPIGSLRSAVDQRELDELWAAVGLTGDAPAIGSRVVVSITIPDDACPPELVRFERDGDVLTPVFVEPEAGCIEPLIPKTYVVALHDRAALRPAFTLLLPADAPYHDGAELVVPIPDDGTPGATTTVPPPCTEPAVADGPGVTVVDVYLTCGDETLPADLVRVPRAIPTTEAPLRAALEALLAGPTSAEAVAGFTSGIPEQLRGAPVDVALDDEGVARIDIDFDLSTIPNISASAMTIALVDPIYATALQFDSVTAVELGSFCAATELACDTPVTREDLESMLDR
jgi:hypothetical protein